MVDPALGLAFGVEVFAQAAVVRSSGLAARACLCRGVTRTGAFDYRWRMAGLVPDSSRWVPLEASRRHGLRVTGLCRGWERPCDALDAACRCCKHGHRGFIRRARQIGLAGPLVSAMARTNARCVLDGGLNAYGSKPNFDPGVPSRRGGCERSSVSFSVRSNGHTADSIVIFVAKLRFFIGEPIREQKSPFAPRVETRSFFWIPRRATMAGTWRKTGEVSVFGSIRR
jgi:hypothetical protein